MSTKSNIEYTNKQVAEQAAKGRGRLAGVVRLDPRGRELMDLKFGTRESKRLGLKGGDAL